ncbi:MAG: DUF2203 domain-containing protein [Acidobacteriota bacterium]
MTSDPRSKRTFTYEEALSMFPVVRDRTAAAVRQVEALVNQIRSRDDAEARKEELEVSYRRILEAWTEEIQSLGCEVKGPWLVDWDNGDGYYCWKYPEDTLGHFHTYEDGFTGRVPVN